MLKKILKTEAVKEEILCQIKSKGLKDGDFICNEKDLMKVCEVGRVTVRRAINQLSTRGIVLVINGKGTFVGSKALLEKQSGSKRKIIELVTPVQLEGGIITGWGAVAVMVEIEKGIAAKSNFNLIFSNTHGEIKTERRALKDAVDGPCDIVILEPVYNSTERSLKENITFLSQSHKPFIISDRFVPFNVNNVFEDDFHGAYLATSHLIAHGHTSILHINFAGEHFENRRKGYKRALTENGLLIDDNLIYGEKLKAVNGVYTHEYEDFYDLGYRAVCETLKKRIKFTGIFAVNDKAAEGAIMALRENGMKVPDDVSVVGYDNRDELKELGISSIERPFAEIGRIISEVIVDKLDNDDSDNVTRIGVKPCLVEKSSVRSISLQTVG